jgi:hypothetical protein
MVIMDFESTPMQAFTHGFVKGLTAPVMLLGQHKAPPVNIPAMIQSSQTTIEHELIGDWANISADLHLAVGTYESTK